MTAFLWRDPRRPGDGPWDPTSPPCSAGFVAWCPMVLGFWVAGDRGSRIRAARHAAAPSPARRRPARRHQRSRGGRRLSLGRHRPWTGALPAECDPPMMRARPGQRLALGPGPEFDRIRKIAQVLGEQGTGLGDDCGLVSEGEEFIALSTDVSVEGVHFRPRLDLAPRRSAGALPPPRSPIWRPRVPSPSVSSARSLCRRKPRRPSCSR